jgi:hypothetical protein
MIEWKEIEGYENEYEISDQGDVRNIQTNRLIVKFVNGGY